MWKTKGILVLLAIIPFVLLGGGTLHAATGNGAGYFFIDSNEPGGPAFVFEDIRSTGTVANITAFDVDDGAVNVAIGFPFLFNGTGIENAPAFTNAVISSNGHLDFFDSPTVDISNRTGDCNWTWNGLDLGIPSFVTDCNGETWGANPFLAVWFGDLNPDKSTGLAASDIYYELKGTAPNQRFIVQWETPPFGTLSNCVALADMLIFQTILYESTNEVLYQYADATTSVTCDDGSKQESMGGSATVGLSFTNTTGLEYSANQQVITDRLAVMFGPGEVSLTVDTDSIDFGNVQAGSVANTSVVVTNAGSSPLIINGIGVDDPLAPPYRILTENCVGIANTIAPAGGTCTMIVAYDPATASGGTMFASAGMAGGFVLFGIVAGGTRNRRILAALIVAALLVTGMFLASCGGGGGGGGPTTVAFTDSFDIDSDDDVRPEVTVSVNGTTRR